MPITGWLLSDGGMESAGIRVGNDLIGAGRTRLRSAPIEAISSIFLAWAMGLTLSPRTASCNTLGLPTCMARPGGLVGLRTSLGRPRLR